MLLFTILAACHPGATSAPCARCGAPPPPAPTSTPDCEDGDGDGAFLAAEGCPLPADCDDADGGIHPGADETCDGRDEDCDGETDEDAVDVPTVGVDADGDGFAGDATARGCGLVDPPGGDCDDADVDVHPGGAEVPANGLDDDCDGQPGPPAWPATLDQTAAQRVDDAVAMLLCGASDLDGDGAAELLVPVYTQPSWNETEITWTLRSAGGATLELGPGNLYEGCGLPGDATGDGYGDLLLPVELGGAVDLVAMGAAGPVAGGTVVLDLAEDARSYSMTGGDLDGDGDADLWVGVRDDTHGNSTVLVPSPPAAGSLVDQAVLNLRGHFGYGPAVGAPVDFDGDGVLDLPSASMEGIVVVEGTERGVLALEDARWRLGGLADQVSSPGDLDGDGVDDLLATPNCTYAPEGLWVLPGGGSFTGQHPDDVAIARFHTREWYDPNAPCAGVGFDPLELDGTPGLALAQWGNPERTPWRVFLVPGSVRGVVDAPTAAVSVITSTFDGDSTGRIFAADLDGDLSSEVLVAQGVTTWLFPGPPRAF